MSKAMDSVFDRLPTWAKVAFWLAAFSAIVYGIARYGWVFLLKMIFSPEF